MSNYKGYLPGINPNYTKKILQDDDDRYFALDSGRFVNGLGQEVKTMKEKNKIENDYFELACKTHNSGIFEEILVARMPKETVKFARDNRHFLTGEMKFEKYSC